MKTIVLAWLRENLQRLFIKSPRFFKIWIWISGMLVLITGIPDFINALPFPITMSDMFSKNLTIAIAWASRGVLVMAMLTTQSKPIGITQGGEVVKKTDEKLPFTVASEQKIADKVAVVEIKPVPNK